jgi:predicted O-methyltransferase YrrM
MSTWDDWYLGKKFSSDWTSRHFETWAEHLAGFEDAEVSVLEIGSWEGRSAIFFLNFMRRSRLTCIEPFTGSAEHGDIDALSALEERFDANVAPFGARVEKIKSRSLPALDALAQQGRMFEIIYIDGSHQADDVLMDSILCWRILRNDGVLIWDDYLWGVPDLPEKGRPKRAIDILGTRAGEYEFVHRAAQIIVTKRIPKKVPPDAEWTFPRTLENFGRFLTRRPLRSPRIRSN